MDNESQYLLFALSAPMEILNENCSPSHTSPKMYLGIEDFDLESSWGINKRKALLRTIYSMTDDGHAVQLNEMYHRWFRHTPLEWQKFVNTLNEQNQIFARYVADTAVCCGEGGIRAWDYVRMGFLCRVGVLNKWLTEEESLWIQSRLQIRALHYYSSWMQYFSAYSLGRLYWRWSDEGELPQLREQLVRKEFDKAERKMMSQLVAGADSYYTTLPWRYLTAYPECPITLKDISDL